MPGYGIYPPNEGTGLLPWSWAKRRLQTSRNFWVVTLWPDGRPRAMPVWGVFDDDERFWFSSAVRSRNALNYASDPRCMVASEDEQHPVVLNGEGEIRTSREELAHVPREAVPRRSVDTAARAYAALGQYAGAASSWEPGPHPRCAARRASSRARSPYLGPTRLGQRDEILRVFQPRLANAAKPGHRRRILGSVVLPGSPVSRLMIAGRME